MPLDDELSDIRYAPREILVRAIRTLVKYHGISGMTEKEMLAAVGLVDGEGE